MVVGGLNLGGGLAAGSRDKGTAEGTGPDSSVGAPLLRDAGLSPLIAPDTGGGVTLISPTVSNFADSLSLPSGGSIYLFAMSVGGAHYSSDFSSGDYVTGTGANGEVASALAVTTSASDSFSTQDTWYTIGGVGVSGYSGYTESDDVYVPPVQPSSSFSYTFSVGSDADVVFLATSGGQCCLSLSGIVGLSVDASWNSNGGVGLEIANADMSSGTYTVTASSTNNDGGSSTRADIIGVFQFVGPVASSTYPVTFAENGVPNPSPGWNLSFSGAPATHLTAPTTSFSEPDGTYSYNVSAPTPSGSPVYYVVGEPAGPGYQLGQVTVSGAPVTVQIRFFQQTTVDFHVDQSAVPGPWTVEFRGTSPSTWPFNGTDGPYSGFDQGYSAENGTYSFVVIPPTGYTASPASGSLTVSGGPVTVQVTFTATSGGSGESIGFLTPCVNGLRVDINGGAAPGSEVTSISWTWGDGSSTTQWFPASHLYGSAGAYTVTATAHYVGGGTASTSTSVTVGSGLLDNCNLLTIVAGQGGDVSYSASVATGTISAGNSLRLYLASEDDLTLSAQASSGDSFSSWTVVGSITAPGGAPLDDEDSSILAVIDSSGSIEAAFASGTATIQFVTGPTTCGFITFNGATYTNGKATTVAAPGVYSVSATPCLGYHLPGDDVTGTGEVTVNDGLASVEGNGGITASFVPYVTNYVVQDEFGVGSPPLNTSQWSVDSSVLSGIVSSEDSAWGLGGVLGPPSSGPSYSSSGMTWTGYGVDSWFGLTSSVTVTPPISAQATASMSGFEGNPMFFCLATSLSSQFICSFLSTSLYVASGPGTPISVGELPTAGPYSVWLNATTTAVWINLTGSGTSLSTSLTFSPNSEAYYVIVGTYAGGFPGELYRPPFTDSLTISSLSISSPLQYTLVVTADYSTGGGAAGATVTLTNELEQGESIPLSSVEANVFTFSQLLTGEYLVETVATSNGQTAFGQEYLSVGNPLDPESLTVPTTVTLQDPEIQPLSVYAQSLDPQTSGQAPFAITVQAYPSNGTFDYSYSWTVNGVSEGTDSGTLQYTIPSAGSYAVEVMVTCVGPPFFGQTCTPPKSPTEATSIPVIFTATGITSYTFSLTPDPPQTSLGTIQVQYQGQPSVLVNFTGVNDTVSADMAVNLLSSVQIPSWLSDILGISTPYYSAGLSDAAGTSTGFNFPIQSNSINSFSGPPTVEFALPSGTPTTELGLTDYTLTFTANPTSLFALALDAVAAAFAAIGLAIAKIANSLVALANTILNQVLQLYATQAINLWETPPSAITQFFAQIAPSIFNALIGMGAALGLTALTAAFKSLTPVGWILAAGDFIFDLATIAAAAAVGPLAATYQLTGPTYMAPVSFSESGLPAGTTWGVGASAGGASSGMTLAISSKRSGISSSVVSPSDAESSFASAIAPNPVILFLSNGTWNYSIGNLSGYRENTVPSFGTVVMSGSPIAEPTAHYQAVTYALTFAETGLPLGKTWTTSLNGQRHSATNQLITFTEPNGSFDYVVAAPAGYVITGMAPSGELSVTGAAVTYYLQVTPGSTHTLTFDERGLPKQQPWCVNLSGWESCSTGSTDLYKNLTTGSYAYQVVPMSGQLVTAKLGKTTVPLSGMLAVVGSETVVLTYVYQYVVTFTETGLSSGSWSVTVAGLTKTSTFSAPIVFDEPNGTFAYKVGTRSGYIVFGGWARVVGGPAFVTVAFHPRHPAPVLYTPSAQPLASVSPRWSGVRRA
jgi:hypothetical protein